MKKDMPDYAIYGNVDGSHQLIDTNIGDQISLLEELRFLVDRPIGHIGQEIVWSPFWGCGPLHDSWVIWYGEEDGGASRKNMVRSHVVILKKPDLNKIDNLNELLRSLPIAFPLPENEKLSALILDNLARGDKPVIVPDIQLLPSILMHIWPSVWPSARFNLSFRTCLGVEVLESGHIPDVIFIPDELKPRWQSHNIVNTDDVKSQSSTKEFLKQKEPELGSLIQENWEMLPRELTALNRLDRIASKLRLIKSGKGTFADALLIIRTIESFEASFSLKQKDFEELINELSLVRQLTITDVRAASLTQFQIVKQILPKIATGISLWIERELTDQSDDDSIWIIDKQFKEEHLPWWTEAIRKGISNGLATLNSKWANAVWNWWKLDIDTITCIQNLLPRDSETEKSLIDNLPSKINVELIQPLIDLCSKRGWLFLLSNVLADLKEAEEAIKIIRDEFSEPENGIPILLKNKTPEILLSLAIDTEWAPVIKFATSVTIEDEGLFENHLVKSRGLILMLSEHLSLGGVFPHDLKDSDLVCYFFDEVINGDDSASQIITKLGPESAPAALFYTNQNALWEALETEVSEPILDVTAELYLKEFFRTENLYSPCPKLFEKLRERAFNFLNGGPINNLIKFIKTFPEVSEREVIEWLRKGGFAWKTEDIEEFGDLLIDREWKNAVRQFKWSWKEELKALAFQARGLLDFWESLWLSKPTGIDIQEITAGNYIQKREGQMIKILFLASNPMESQRLALDEEARSIEQKLRSAKLRDEIVLKTNWALRPSDLQQILLEEEPGIVHFSGHGGGDIGIVLHSENKTEERLVTTEALSDLFKVLKGNIQVVVLNACYSEVQAKAIIEHIDFAIGMSDSIGDEAAISFAAAFYRGVAFGKSVQTSFELGLNELKLEGMTDDQDIPVLHVRHGVDASIKCLLK